MDWIKEDVTYTATIKLSSEGSNDRVHLEEIIFSPDIPDSAIDSGEVPWSYKLASFLLAKLRQEAVELEEDDEELLTILDPSPTVH